MADKITLKLAPANETLDALLADGGWKYLSEDVWSRDLGVDHDEVESLSLW